MMNWLRRFFQRLRLAFPGKQMDQELEMELAAHVEFAIEENLQRGMPPEEARRQALIQMGGAQQARERHREARRLAGLATFFQDLHYATRGLIKSPGFTSAAVLTLALGIAVNATMFSMVSGYLLRRPSVREPERVAVVSSISPVGGPYSDTNTVSVPNYLAWRAANDVFENIAAADVSRMVNLTLQGRTRALPAAAVAPDFFTVLGVTPELGRNFTAGEAQPGRDHVVILGHELWARDFGSDASLLGRTIRINREDYSVAGVMPANFRLMGVVSQLWIPLTVSAADQTADARNNRFLTVFARMKPGTTIEQVQAEMKTLGSRAEADFPNTEKGWGVVARTLPDFLIYSFGIRAALVMAMTVVGFVLLIACANVAGLLLARAGGRRKELAIRMSLGASRLRIIRQLLTEGLMIALAGGGIGLLLAFWGIQVVRVNMAFNEAVRAVPLTLDWNVLLFALGTSLLSAILCSLAPALRASRTDINTHLKDESRAASAGRSQSRLRTLLVTAEIAMALFLLIGTGLLLRGIYLLQHQNLGFQAEHMLTAGLTLDSARYKDASQQALFVQRLMPGLRQIPGAEAVAAGSELPAVWSNNITVRIKGRQDLPANRLPRAFDVVATTDYFRAAGIPLVRGRVFTENDDAAATQVVVVNEEFVHRHLQDQEPLGQQIHPDVSGATAEWREIVGVVANVKTFSQQLTYDPQVYEPFLQRPVSSFSLMIRTSHDPSSLAQALNKAVAQADVELPLTQVLSMTAVIDLGMGASAFFLWMLGTFALLALILAAIGIYGLLAYSIGQRRQEIAIRMAVGASGREVKRMVLGEGFKMTGIGAVIGLLVALPLPKVFESALDGLRTGDPRIYVVVPIVILAVAMLATYIPARRAARIDPMMALHSE